MSTVRGAAATGLGDGGEPQGSTLVVNEMFGPT